MAAATVVTLYADSVVGDMRVRKVNITLAATGDSYEVVGATQIFSIDIIGPDTTVITPTNTPSDTVVFNYTGGGGKTGVQLMVTYI